jgi:hypothetical protein
MEQWDTTPGYEQDMLLRGFAREVKEQERAAGNDTLSTVAAGADDDAMRAAGILR